MVLVSMERRNPTPYDGTKQLYFGPVNFKFTGGGNHPLWEDVLLKKLRKARVKHEKSLQAYVQATEEN